MAGQNRGSSPDIISELKLDLMKEGHSFSFFQVMRLLRLLYLDSADKKSAGPSEADLIRVRPKLSLSFPAADVDSIEEISNEESTRIQITANFLGLYGTSSPLPTFYTEELMDESAADESVTREFIDVINHRLFELFHDCCTKYQQTFQVVEKGSNQHTERLFCLLGLGDSQLRSQISDPYSMLRYLGLFTQMPRSAIGLETLLKDVLNGMDVSVLPCIERKAKIPDDQKLRLGVPSSRLGNNSILGEEVSDRMGKFRVQIGPLGKNEFQDFYPGSEINNKVRLLMKMYVPGSLEYDMEVILAEGQAQTACLGDHARSELGLNSWIFSGDRIGELRTIYQQ
jgi:type VI secretion system protein ImpH